MKPRYASIIQHIIWEYIEPGVHFTDNHAKNFINILSRTQTKIVERIWGKYENLMKRKCDGNILDNFCLNYCGDKT